MKCVFATLPYQFTVQYHADALVAAHTDTAWLVSLDGVANSYRRQECLGADGERDPHCAVFVPSAMARREAALMLAAFKLAHPGVIPPHLVFPYERDSWWLRAQRRLSSRSDYQHDWNDSSS